MHISKRLIRFSFASIFLFAYVVGESAAATDEHVSVKDVQLVGSITCGRLSYQIVKDGRILAKEVLRGI